MKNHMIKCGVAAPSLKVADVKYNLTQIIKIASENKDCGVIVFPELSLCGYTCGDLFASSLLAEGCEKAMVKLCEESKNWNGLTLVVGVPVRFMNSLYNCAAIISEGRLAGIIPKTNLPTYGEFYEGRWFESGAEIIDMQIDYANQRTPFGVDILACDEVSGAVLGCEICEDLWVPDKPSTHACLAGANIIANPSASDELIGKRDYRRELVAQQSGACYCGYLYASSGVGESSADLVYSGALLVAENGSVFVDQILPEENTIGTAIIDLDKINYNRVHQSTFTSSSIDEYHRVDVSIKSVGNVSGEEEITVDKLVKKLKDEKYPVATNPFVPADDEERGKRCKKILSLQANGLATRVRATGIKTLVIGISGGLDSTLALLVCNEARKLVPDIRVIGYTMPKKGNTSSLTYNNAVDLMKCLKVEIREVEIGDAVADHLQAIGHGNEYQGEGDTTYENAQARMRTYILMDAANMENGLVVGTGDLSELALGWCTYNGDHMSMYAVNASVPKTLVSYICRSYALTCGDKKLCDVLLSICDTPITPELTPSKDGEIAQKTEEKIGKYDLNDFFLFYTLRFGFDPEKIMALAMVAYEGLSKEFMKDAMVRFYRRFFTQQFKRSCLPDGPKVGSVTLSPRGDWRMPSDASSALWIERVEKA